MKVYWSRTNHVIWYKDACYMYMAKDANTRNAWRRVKWFLLTGLHYLDRPHIDRFLALCTKQPQVGGNSEELFLKWTTVRLLVKLCLHRTIMFEVDNRTSRRGIIMLPWYNKTIVAHCDEFHGFCTPLGTPLGGKYHLPPQVYKQHTIDPSRVQQLYVILLIIMTCVSQMSPHLMKWAT